MSSRYRGRGSGGRGGNIVDKGLLKVAIEIKKQKVLEATLPRPLDFPSYKDPVPRPVMRAFPESMTHIFTDDPGKSSGYYTYVPPNAAFTGKHDEDALYSYLGAGEAWELPLLTYLVPVMAAGLITCGSIVLGDGLTVNTPLSSFIRIRTLWIVLLSGLTVASFFGLYLYMHRHVYYFSWRHMVSMAQSFMSTGVWGFSAILATILFQTRTGVASTVDKSVFLESYLYSNVLVGSTFATFLGFPLYWLIQYLVSANKPERIMPLESISDDERIGLVVSNFNRFAEKRLFVTERHPLPDLSTRDFHIYQGAKLSVFIQFVTSVLYLIHIMNVRYLNPATIGITFVSLNAAVVVYTVWHTLSYKFEEHLRVSWRHIAVVMGNVLGICLMYAIQAFAVIYWLNIVASDPQVSPTEGPTKEYIAFGNSIVIFISATLPSFFFLYTLWVEFYHAESNEAWFVSSYALDPHPMVLDLLEQIADKNKDLEHLKKIFIGNRDKYTGYYEGMLASDEDMDSLNAIANYTIVMAIDYES